jgi:hypothetical protein
VEFGSLVSIEVFLVDLMLIFISTHFELINKYDMSGAFSTFREDEKKAHTEVFMSVTLRAKSNSTR